MIRKTFDALRKLFLILNSKQKLLGAGVLLCTFFAAILEVLGVSAIVPLVNALLQPETLYKKPYIKVIVELLNINTDKGLVIFVITSIIALYMFKNLFFSFHAWLKSKYSGKVRRECSVYMMQSYMNRGYDFFLNRNVNEIIQGVDRDILALYNIINALFQAVTQLAISLFICIYMCYADWQIALGVIVSAVFCLFIIFFVFRKKMLLAGMKQRKYDILTSQILLQAFQGIKEVFVMRKQKYFAQEYEKNNIQRQNTIIVQSVGAEIPAYIIEGICVTGIMIILGVRIISVSNAGNLVATLAAFAVGAFRILPALGKISMSLNTVMSGMPSLNAVYENMVEAKRYNDNFYNVDTKDDAEFQDMDFTRSIVVRNLSFFYNSEQNKVLDNLNLEIPKGRSIAFVGESGAGKSTLADLILGVLSPSSGEVLMDGVNIRKIPNRWSRLIGYVPQSIYLCDDTVCKNIAFGVKENQIDEKRVTDALAKAELLDFVMSLPQGIHTEVGDRGVRLSGGQRQRIGIARALYHDPEILVLDEATSALDNATERSVMEAIDALHGKMTLIIIAHRLTTIRNCDVIYEIADGKAVERTYHELTDERR